MKTVAQIVHMGLVAVLLSSCATLSLRKDSIPSWDEINKATPNQVDLSAPIDLANFDVHLREFTDAVKKEKGKRQSTPKTLGLYRIFESDRRLLRERLNVISPDLVLMIPPHSKVTVPFRWFCLNSDRHCPDPNEYVSWIKGDPGVPYYSQILRYAFLHQDAQRIQNLLWNLQQKVPYSSFPISDQKMLFEIDPTSPVKLTFADLKNSYLNQLAAQAYSTPIGSMVSQAKSQYRDFSYRIGEILNSHSTLPMPHAGEPQVIDADPLFASSVYSGFHVTTSFFNLASTVFKLDLSKIHLDPVRKDVQREALVPPPPDPDEKALLDRMDRADEDVKPYITPVDNSGTSSTVDHLPAPETKSPNVFPVGEPGPTNTVDSIPPPTAPPINTTQPPQENPKTPLKEGDVGPYGQEIKKGTVADGLTPDHIPSFAAVKRAEERSLGRALTPAEARALNNRLNTLVVKEGLHKIGRTYGGKNTPRQIEEDSQDLGVAAKKDVEIYLQNAQRVGSDLEAIKRGAAKLDQLNHEQGLY